MPFLIFAVLFYILAVTFCGYAIASYFIYKGWNNPPYIPSFGKTKKAVIAEVSKFLTSEKQMKIADLGCGDGSLLAGLAPKFPNHYFYGYEWDPFPYQIAKRRLKKYKNTRIIRADLMKTDLKHLDVALCYLAHIPGLGDRLKKALKPSAVVISEVFEIDGWKPQKIVQSRLFGFKSKIFIYRVRDQKFLHH
ncbi:MAG: class I SAM-dependent methyltransferase [Alphaproteobacteria bacterium]|nr:class I SAM-dependent methyltransferase [Alphaproteobacteria bacterium]